MAQNCIEEVYKKHTSCMDRYYEEVRDNIIDDMLMGKVVLKPEGVTLVGMTEKVKKLIDLFYKVAKKLYIPCSFTVYRGTRPIKIAENTLFQPIPFSTSLVPENAMNWIDEDEKCCIWRINVPKDSLFLCIDNPNEGKEVILPAGMIRIIKSSMDSIRVYECEFIPDNGSSVS